MLNKREVRIVDILVKFLFASLLEKNTPQRAHSIIFNMNSGRGASHWGARRTSYGLKTRFLYLLRCESALKAPQRELLWYLLEYCASQ